MTEVSLDVIIMSDRVLENNEIFQLSINSSSLPNHVTVDNPSEITVTIVDNDCKFLFFLLFSYVSLIIIQLLLSTSVSQYTVFMKMMDQYNLY